MDPVNTIETLKMLANINDDPGRFDFIEITTVTVMKILIIQCLFILISEYKFVSLIQYTFETSQK